VGKHLRTDCVVKDIASQSMESCSTILAWQRAAIHIPSYR
jgi:hypothetical protein